MSGLVEPIASAKAMRRVRRSAASSERGTAEERAVRAFMAIKLAISDQAMDDRLR